MYALYFLPIIFKITVITVQVSLPCCVQQLLKTISPLPLAVNCMCWTYKLSDDP